MTGAYAHLHQYLTYVKNTGGAPAIEWFDDDFEPIGPDVRRDMRNAGLIIETDGKIYLTEKGKVIA